MKLEPTKGQSKITADAVADVRVSPSPRRSSEAVPSRDFSSRRTGDHRDTNVFQRIVFAGSRKK